MIASVENAWLRGMHEPSMTKHLTTAQRAAPLSPEQIADNFGDLHPPLTRAQAAVEASQCLYCYDAPCVQACPTGIDIPTFIRQIGTGNLAGSGQTILSENIMGGTCARACPTEVLCEGACVVNHTKGAPVKIGLLQRVAVDHVMATAKAHPFARAADSGRHIAVVGAGPAGLSFAHRAAMLGHKVTVYEARERAGGLNEYGLAAYKMVDDFAQREVEFLLGIGGIALRHGVAVGRGVTLAELRRSHDAVFIGVGLARPASPALPGEALAGVQPAIRFIETLRRARAPSTVPIGQRVVVVGGGNTAIDAAVQARCLGAASVTLLYRRGPEQMSATTWEQDLARMNGVVMRFWSAPVAVEGTTAVTGVRVAATALVDGKLAMTDQVELLAADQLLLAVGQQLDLTPLDDLRLEGGKIWIDADYQTALPGVFAGGDAVRSGEDLTVQAVEDGKRAAHRVDAMLAKGISR